MNSKKKGNRVEQEIVKSLKERFKKEFKRVPSSGALFGKSNYNESFRKDALEILSGDIITPDDFIFSIEVKSRKDFNFWDFFSEKSEINKDWIKQCEFDAKKTEKLPLLIIKINNKKVFCLFKHNEIKTNFLFKNWQIILFEDFLKIEDSFFNRNDLNNYSINGEYNGIKKIN